MSTLNSELSTLNFSLGRVEGSSGITGMIKALVVL